MNRIKTFLFAIIVLMGITGVMTSCQGDAPVINYTTNITVTNDFKKPGGGEIILDGVTMPITDTGIDEYDLNVGYYNIVLFVTETKGVKIMADKAYHDGNTIDLTKKEPKHDDGWYWSVECYNPNLIIDTYGEPGTPYPVFMSGTLSVKYLGSEDGKPVFEIVLKNGKVKCEGEYGDGKEHTISLNYKGTLDFDDF